MKKKSAFLREHRLLLLGCFVCVVIFLAICYPGGLYFLCDDFAHIPEASRGNLFQTSLLRPVVYFTLWLDIKLWAIRPVGFHLTNLTLHVLNSCTAFFLVRIFLKRYSKVSAASLPALLSALFFLCYAFHSEPIFWIDARGSVLATLFIQLSLLFYFRPGAGCLVVSLLFFIISLFTYELSWVLPLLLTVLFIYERFIQKQQPSLYLLLPFWILFLAFLYFRYAALHTGLSNYEASKIIARNYSALAYNYAMLVARLAIPPLQSGKLFLLLFAFTAVFFISVLAYIYSRARQQLAFILLVIGCTGLLLLPAISLGIDSHDTESERYLYPASLFFCLLMVFILQSLIKKMNHLFGIVILITGFHLYLLYQSSMSYRYASYISKFVIESLNSVPGVKTVVIKNLPTQYNGALLFRIGFPRFAPGILATTYDTIEIKSFRELTTQQHFTRFVTIQNEGANILHLDFERDSLLLSK